MLQPPSLPAPSPRPRLRRKSDRPGELLAAALTLFVQKGYAATRVEEVAAQAGVSKGTLFRYFPSKEDLFKAVVRENIAGHFVQWQREFEAFEGTSEALLRQCYAVWWQRIGSTELAGIAKLMFSEAGNFPGLASFYEQEVMQPGRSLVRRILERGVARGEIRPLDLDTGVYLVLAPMLFLMLWQHSMAPCLAAAAAPMSGVLVSPDNYLAAQIDNLLRGLQPRP